MNKPKLTKREKAIVERFKRAVAPKSLSLDQIAIRLVGATPQRRNNTRRRLIDELDELVAKGVLQEHATLARPRWSLVPGVDIG